jgi:hypothetical protein
VLRGGVRPETAGTSFDKPVGGEDPPTAVSRHEDVEYPFFTGVRPNGGKIYFESSAVHFYLRSSYRGRSARLARASILTAVAPGLVLPGLISSCREILI